MGAFIRRLGGLNDFECAARLGSFRDAAEALHKTPAAVSMQVKQLERSLGYALFVRHPRRIELTERGRELAATVGRALAQIEAKALSLRDIDLDAIVNVSSTHSFSMKWLAPRLHRFAVERPDLDVRLHATDEVVSLEAGVCDVAIRHGSAGAAGELFEDRLVAVVAPSTGATSLEAALRLPRLHEGDEGQWRRCFDLVAPGIEPAGVSRRYSHAGLLVQAAAAGLGVALVPYSLACEDLRQGRLRLFPDAVIPAPTGYRVVTTQERRPAVDAFEAWLRHEAAQMMAEMRSAIGRT